MKIEITRPETEALIQQCLSGGAFIDTEELILQALRSLEHGNPTGADLVAAMRTSPYREINLEPERDRMPVRDVSF